MIVWEKNRALYLHCGVGRECVSLESMMTSLGSNEGIRVFLSRVLFIVPFKPQLKGDVNSLVELRPLPDGYFLVLRAPNVNEVHRSRNSRLLQFQEKESELVLVSLWKFQKQVEVDQIEWPE